MHQNKDQNQSNCLFICFQTNQWNQAWTNCECKKGRKSTFGDTIYVLLPYAIRLLTTDGDSNMVFKVGEMFRSGLPLLPFPPMAK